MKMKESQFELIKKQLKRLTSQDGFYSRILAGVDVDAVKSQEDFEKLPFTWKGDLREAYPLGLQAVPEEEIVRIHSSSGTTGTPVIIPYTKQDVDDWAEMFARDGRHHQAGPHPHHPGLRPLDGGNRLPAGSRAPRRHDYPYGPRQHRQAA